MTFERTFIKNAPSNAPIAISTAPLMNLSSLQPPQVTQIILQPTPEPQASDLVEEELAEHTLPVDYTELAKLYDLTEEDGVLEQMGSSASFTSPRVSESSDPGDVRIHHMDESDPNHSDDKEEVHVVKVDRKSN
ncbi:hypothetical protein BJ742DRAFT_780492 [Cladochytrium replicatum]|nr:hypothetical protein BJ742DRAFT_780492 [Cladochytrium replicatum]